jgi:uncharacterized protein YndB with AHSA1/START domain
MTTPMQITEAPGELTIKRTHAAPIDLVFGCMTDPAHLTHFWGPKGSRTPVDGIVVDLRPGGAFQTTMVGGDGGEHTMRAVYVEVERPTRLVWTDSESGMTTTVDFVAIDERTTEVTTHQTNLPAWYAAPGARQGFLSSLDRFDDYLNGLTGDA